MSSLKFRIILFVVISFSVPLLQAADLTDLPAADRARVKITNNKNTGNASFLRVDGPKGLAHRNNRRPPAPEAAATDFLSTYGFVFGVTSSNPLSELNLTSKRENGKAKARSKYALKYQQKRRGIPVFGAEMVVRLDSEFKVTGANGNISSTPVAYNLSRDKKAGKNNALDVVTKNDKRAKSANLSISNPKLYIYNAALFGNGIDQERPANLYEVTNKAGYINYTVLVDAETNAVLTYFSNNKNAKNRSVHDQNENFTLPLPSGNVVRSEGDAPYGQVDVDDAYDFSGDTYDFLLNEHGRDSLDGAGFPLVSAVRYCVANSCPYANAFWNGVHMTYGSGFATDDVVAHELIHGFTQFTSNLIYLNESGAINESLSDIWGEWVDLGNGAGNDTAAVRWLVGEDIPGIGAIRNMQDPPAFGDADRVGSPIYYCGTSDSGGVHSNSGVNNKAAVLLSDGGTFNGFNVNGIGIPKTADIYYQAQTAYLTQSSGYNDLYNALNSSCNDLIGVGGITAANCAEVDKALLAVEMNGNVCSAPPLVEYCPVGETMNASFSDGFESGNLANWTINNLVGSNSWINTNTAPFSGTRNAHGNNPSVVSDSALELSSNVVVPANAFVAFDHIPNIENSFDGGVVEYSTDSGSTWSDLLTNGVTVDGENYSGVVSSSFGNPLGGRNAFFNIADYRRTKIGLASSLTGSNLRLRFRIGTDSIVSAPGWDIDNVEIYQCSAAPPTGKSCAGHAVTVDLTENEVPTNGNDVIWGTTGDDIIYGLGGNDIICGNTGHDIIRGGDGYDIIYGGAGNDQLFGDNSFDDLYGGTGNDKLFGGTSADSDWLFGQAGSDTLFDQNGYGSAWGGDGPDSIYAGLDGVYAEGGAQNDKLYGGPGSDHLNGQSGADLIGGYGGNDFLYGGDNADSINGGANDDYVEGGPGNDRIWGGGGDDTLNGNANADIILGGSGNDGLFGGAGNDTLNGQGQTDDCNGGTGNDTAIKCETLTSVPFQALAGPAGLLPDVRPSEAIIKLLDNCEATIHECLTPAQRAQLQR